MKPLFKERVKKATLIKCREMDSKFAGRLERVKREYDEDFGVAVGIREGLRFILMDNRIILDDTVKKRYAFAYDRKQNKLEIGDDDELYDLILSYLAVCQNIDKAVVDIVTDIEKKLDIVSRILDGADEEAVSKDDYSVNETNVGDTVKESLPAEEDTAEPEKEPEWVDSRKDNMGLPNIPDERPSDDDEPVRDDEEDISEEESSTEDTTERNEQMARNVVEKSRNPFEAMRVLQSLGFSPDDFEKYGISAKDVAEFKQLLKEREAEQF